MNDLLLLVKSITLMYRESLLNMEEDSTKDLEGKANKGVLAYVIENEFEESEVLCLDYDDSFMISGFEVDSIS